ncbi:MAG: extracellular solute-binding protein [Saccharofermentanales bacterium]
MGTSKFRAFSALLVISGMLTLPWNAVPDVLADDSRQWGEQRMLSAGSAVSQDADETPAATARSGQIIMDSSGITESSEVSVEEIIGEESVLFQKNESFAVWSLDVPSAGNYRIMLSYASVSDKIGDFEIVLLVNDELQLPSADGIRLPRRYLDIGKISQDKRGNDIRPEKIEEKIWIDHDVRDARGIYNDPLEFMLEEGLNTIRIQTIRAGFAIRRIIAYQPSEMIDYAAYADSLSETVSNASGIFEAIEAEQPLAVSSTVLYPTYDKSSAATTPSDPVKLKLNTIGQSNWKMPGQWMEWEIDVPEDGFYNIGMRVRQNYLRGYFSTRTVSIDGNIPFEEMKNIRFPYGIGWNIKVLGDDVTDYLFFLNKGTHIIRMEAVPGVAGKVLSEFNPVVLSLNTLYRKMIMITGISPDQYRDYQLHKDIPGLLEEFRSNADILDGLKESIAGLGIQSGSDAVVVEKLISQIESFIDRPDSIPLRLEDFRNNISSVSSWLLNLKEQPLEIDYIFLKTEDTALPAAGAGFFSQLGYRLKSLAGSFFNDYSMIGDNVSDDKAALKIWINLGRDQSQIIKDLTENYFVDATGVPVNISLVQQGLTEAIAAGKGPDIALYTGVGDSVNFAARGALEDLSKYTGFQSIQSRFMEESWMPFTYQGGVYGIPLQQSFNMMFYRSDIFRELGIGPPRTWDEFYDVLIVIQKNKLLAGIPVGSATAPDNSIFDLLLYQNGGSYYNDDQSMTALDSEVALRAFKQWTDFYRKYSLPVSYDFYNRFRSGEMPLGISGYTMYNMLSVAAPEIEGLWEMVPVPGTPGVGGVVDNTTTGGVNGLLMLKGIRNKEAGYQFIDWFTSAKTQIAYGLAIENIFGQAGRYDTANIEALKEMNWTEKELAVLMAQLSHVRVTPQVPASYYITRSITNAFRSVVIGGKNPRESLFTYNNDMNAELSRKRQELKPESD